MAPAASELIFDSLASLDDVAVMLHSSPKQLRFLLYARPEAQRYSQFVIRKRRGGEHTIKPPKGDLKAIQRRFADLLQDRVVFRQAAHGFAGVRA